MKRCFSIALILALLATTAFAPAQAEGLDVVGEEAEDSVVEIDSIDDADPAPESLGFAPEETLAELAGEPAAEGDLSEIAEPVDEADRALSNDETAVIPEDSNAQTAEAIQLSAASVCIGLGEKYQGLTVSALPEGAAVTWRSGNKKIARVNASTGVITGVRKGSTRIYAKVEGVEGELSCKITVKAKPKKVTVDKALTLGAGMSARLKASVPKGYASGTLTFTSSDVSVAVVDESGTVVGVAPGEAVITVMTYNNKKATCKVKVLAEPASVAFPDSVMPMAVGQTVALTATALTADGVVTPASFTFSVEPSSTDADCVSLDEAAGTLTALRKGRAILRAVAHNGVAARCTVEVDVGPESVALSAESISIGRKEVYLDLLAECTAPAGAETCAQIVTWSSTNRKIATVDATTGAITGVGTGSCTIVATAPNGVSAKCKVKVCKAPGKNNVSLSPKNGVLQVGALGQYKITFDKGYGGSVSFSSTDTNVATVDNDGIVTAVSAGEIKITMTTYNGISKTVSLKVIGNGSSGGKKSGDDEKIQYMLDLAKTKKGAPYVYGSFGPNSFDCSGFAYWCYKQINVKLKDSAYKQGYDTTYPQISYSNLQPGDLVFFNTVDDKDLSDHSGIYLGNGKFIHASSSAGKVIISSLRSGYYKRNFSWGRRVFY